MSDQKTSLTLSNEWYDRAKFIVQIVLPAAGVLYASLAILWGFPKVEEVVGSITAVALFLGVVLRISSGNYDSPETPVGNFTVVEQGNGMKTVKLDLQKDPDTFIENEVISFHLAREEEEASEGTREENLY